MTARLVCLVAVMAFVIGASGCSKKTQPGKSESANGNAGTKHSDSPNANSSADVNLTDEQKQVRALVRSEELLQSLASQMSLVSKSMRDRSLSREKFMEPQVSYRGLADFDLLDVINKLNRKDIQSHLSWPLQNEDQMKAIPSAKLWSPLLDRFQFESCQMGTVATRFVGESFQTDTKFEGRFRTEQNIVGVKAHQTLEWKQPAPGESWRITKWIQSDFEVVFSGNSLFEDITATAIPNKETLDKVQSSSHQALILKNAGIRSVKFKDAVRKYKSFNDWESAFQYPGVSVVDLDQDGFDDLFVTDRWGPAQLLRNKGDGTFEDVTEKSGLDVSNFSCCTLFADFDNDGDSDAFVTRTLEPSMYFENVDGVFKLDENSDEDFEFVRLVVSGSVVDVNGDGLLDVYLNTYGFGNSTRDEAAYELLQPSDRLKLRLKLEKAHWYLDRGGAPNILLLNKGGKLERVAVDDELAQWRNSYQTIWSDFDSDGDQDVYICNDFSPDCFLRNDTERGSFKPEFTNVSKEMVPNGTMGFGMGASWGDYNNDGELDIYISNMYSKAGNRIVPQIDDVDERIKVSARGNFLYEKVGDHFKQVAGLDADDQHISKVGWSFGGQFADFDNDGNLDIYVPSGYYTPPKEVEKPGDW